MPINGTLVVRVVAQYNHWMATQLYRVISRLHRLSTGLPIVRQQRLLQAIHSGTAPTTI